jgi:hypothetical protein
MSATLIPVIKENPMTQHRLTRMIAAGAVGLAGLGALAIPVVSASAATTNPVNTNARCTGTSVANLQVQREDTGKLSVDFGVDMSRHTAGVRWGVAAADNGTLFILQTVQTLSDGSFSVNRMIAPKPGVNTIKAWAVNPATHETCTISGSV